MSILCSIVIRNRVLQSLDGLPDLSLPELFLSADNLYIVHGDSVVMLVNMFTYGSERGLARGFFMFFEPDIHGSGGFTDVIVLTSCAVNLIYHTALITVR